MSFFKLTHKQVFLKIILAALLKAADCYNTGPVLVSNSKFLGLQLTKPSVCMQTYNYLTGKWKGELAGYLLHSHLIR